MGEWSTFENVMRVENVLGSTKFDGLFPLKDDFYNYNDFLHAVAKYPAFCNETNAAVSMANTSTLDKTCKRELSALFAHVAYMSGANDDTLSAVPFKQGLMYKYDTDCHNS